jgi:menaquinone-dependent protoporphyrinogen oxidase
MFMTRKVAIIYSSWHGHTRAIAEHLAGVAAVHNIIAMPCDVHTAKRTGVLIECDAAILVGSVHFGVHHRKLRDFVKTSAARLSAIPSAFVSVSGAAASIDGREKAVGYMLQFLESTGWKPDLKIFVAGAVLYTRYDALTRITMKYASAFAGRGTDTKHDYVYTDWFVLDEFMNTFIGTMDRAALVSPPARR